MSALSHWIETAESQPALLAVRRIGECIGSHRKKRAINPLFLHGPAGTGKTHLAAALVEDTASRRPDLVAAVLAASDLGLAVRPEEDGPALPVFEDARAADLL